MERRSSRRSAWCGDRGCDVLIGLGRERQSGGWTRMLLQGTGLMTRGPTGPVSEPAPQPSRQTDPITNPACQEHELLERILGGRAVPQGRTSQVPGRQSDVPGRSKVFIAGNLGLRDHSGAPSFAPVNARQEPAFQSMRRAISKRYRPWGLVIAVGLSQGQDAFDGIDHVMAVVVTWHHDGPEFWTDDRALSRHS